MKVHAEKHAPSSDSDRSKLRLGNFVIGKLAGGDCLYQRRSSLIRYMVGGKRCVYCTCTTRSHAIAYKSTGDKNILETKLF